MEQDSIFFGELSELELSMLQEDLISNHVGDSLDVIETYAKLLGPTPSMEAISIFSSNTAFIEQFGEDPTLWSAGIEAAFDRQKIKRMAKFGLSGLIRKTSLIYTNKLARRLKWNMERLTTNSNNNDYTKSISLKLLSYRDTVDVLTGLEKLQKLFEDSVNSPKTIDQEVIRKELKKLGIRVGKNPKVRKDWAAIGGTAIGALIGASVLGVLGAIIGARIGRRVSLRSGRIHTRGWTTNDHIQQQTKRAHELLGKVIDMQTDAKKLEKIDVTDMSITERKIFDDANVILKMCEPAFRSVLGSTAAGLAAVVKITAKDVATKTEQVIDKHYVKKKERLSDG